MTNPNLAKHIAEQIASELLSFDILQSSNVSPIYFYRHGTFPGFRARRGGSCIVVGVDIEKMVIVVFKPYSKKTHLLEIENPRCIKDIVELV